MSIIGKEIDCYCCFFLLLHLHVFIHVVHIFLLLSCVCCLPRHFGYAVCWSMHAYVILFLSVFYISQSTSTYYTFVCVWYVNERKNEWYLSLDAYTENMFACIVYVWVFVMHKRWECKGCRCHRKYARANKNTYTYISPSSITHNKRKCTMACVVYDQPTYILVKTSIADRFNQFVFSSLVLPLLLLFSDADGELWCYFFGLLLFFIFFFQRYAVLYKIPCWLFHSTFLFACDANANIVVVVVINSSKKKSFVPGNEHTWKYMITFYMKRLRVYVSCYLSVCLLFYVLRLYVFTLHSHSTYYMELSCIVCKSSLTWTRSSRITCIWHTHTHTGKNENRNKTAAVTKYGMKYCSQIRHRHHHCCAQCRCKRRVFDIFSWNF